MLNLLISRRCGAYLASLFVGLLLSACGIKGGLYLAPNQLPNAKPPAGAETAAPKPTETPTLPAEALHNSSAASPAEMLAPSL